jgi:hypothetical protein
MNIPRSLLPAAAIALAVGAFPAAPAHAQAAPPTVRDLQATASASLYPDGTPIIRDLAIKRSAVMFPPDTPIVRG